MLDRIVLSNVLGQGRVLATLAAFPLTAYDDSPIRRNNEYSRSCIQTRGPLFGPRYEESKRHDARGQERCISDTKRQSFEDPLPSLRHKSFLVLLILCPRYLMMSVLYGACCDVFCTCNCVKMVFHVLRGPRLPNQIFGDGRSVIYAES